MDKLKRQLAEAEAALEARKKPPEETGGPRVAGEGLVIDEWVRHCISILVYTLFLIIFWIFLLCHLRLCTTVP
jgi:hypothetical protein